MIILVCGGRTFHDRQLLFNTLDNLETKPTLIVHGAANGADILSGDWAKKRNIPVKEYPAEWSKYGKSAGPVRNISMLMKEKPDLVIAFPGGRGTAHMVLSARKNGTKVKEI